MAFFVFYATHAVSQIAGGTFNFSTTINGGDAGFRIWIDWNSDGIFNEVAYFSNSYLSTHSGTITIPAGQVAGNYRMRIISDWSLDDADRNPCATGYDKGEFEDYKVIVIDVNAPCSGTPDPGTTVLSPNSGGFSSAVNGSASGATTGGGLTYQWQYSDDGTTWNNIPGQINITLTTPAKNVVGTRQYRRKVTCANGGATATSAPATYTTADIGEPICASTTAFCSTDSYNFSNITTGVAPVGPDYGCLGYRPSPFFYYLKIGTTGNIQLKLEQFNLANQPRDIDFALWGPFISIEAGCNLIMSGSLAPIQCSFNSAAVETIGLGLPGGRDGGASTPPTPQAGEFYILILTNYSEEVGYITLNQTNTGAGAGATDCSITPLPVTLTSLSATCNDGVTIHWTTASEQNSDRFIIEKSRDGQTWSSVGEEVAAGSSNYIIYYNFTNEDNWNGVAYYRLKQVDYNGNQEIFGPISVSCDANGNNMNVYPNPSQGDFKVAISSTEKITDGQIKLVDLTGKIIISQTAIIGIGMNQFNFNQVDLETGTYFVKFTGGNSSFQPVKLVIQ